MENELYKQTVRRLARMGVTDPTSQIIALAEEIERYREKIRCLEGLLSAGGIPLPGKTEYIGITWFPQFSSWESFAKSLEEKYREGWKPFIWAYESPTLTDHRCLGFLLQREALDESL